MDELIRESQINDFFFAINSYFPNLVAGVVTDYHGFPIGSKIYRSNLNLSERELALLTISDRFKIKNSEDYIKIRKTLDSENNINLLLIIKKYKTRVQSFIRLKDILKRHNLFQA